MELTTQQPLAGILTRLIAVLVDGLIASIISLPMTFVTLAVVQSGTADSTMMAVVTFVSLLTIVAIFSYIALVLAMWSRGLTPGKHLMGVRVVHRETGLAVSFWRMVLREVIGKWVAAAICYLGFLWAVFDANKQGWHDKIAGTLVVSTRYSAES